MFRISQLRFLPRYTDTEAYWFPPPLILCFTPHSYMSGVADARSISFVSSAITNWKEECERLHWLEVYIL
jgi:hypothetical protein